EYRSSASLMLMTGLRLGLTGLVIRCMCACSGVRPPFFTLQRTQQQTMFVQLLLPPWLLGTTWSSDSSVVGMRLPQYWQRLESRAGATEKPPPALTPEGSEIDPEAWLIPVTRPRRRARPAQAAFGIRSTRDRDRRGPL